MWWGTYYLRNQILVILGVDYYPSACVGNGVTWTDSMSRGPITLILQI